MLDHFDESSFDEAKAKFDDCIQIEQKGPFVERHINFKAYCTCQKFAEYVMGSIPMYGCEHFAMGMLFCYLLFYTQEEKNQTKELEKMFQLGESE